MGRYRNKKHNYSIKYHTSSIKRGRSVLYYIASIHNVSDIHLSRCVWYDYCGVRSLACVYVMFILYTCIESFSTIYYELLFTPLPSEQVFVYNVYIQYKYTAQEQHTTIQLLCCNNTISLNITQSIMCGSLSLSQERSFISVSLLSGRLNLFHVTDTMYGINMLVVMWECSLWMNVKRHHF